MEVGEKERIGNGGGGGKRTIKKCARLERKGGLGTKLEDGGVTEGSMERREVWREERKVHCERMEG